MKYRINVTMEDGEVVEIFEVDTTEMNWNTQPTRHATANEMFDAIARFDEANAPKSDVQILADTISCMGLNEAHEELLKRGVTFVERVEIIKACFLDSQGRMMGNYDQIARTIQSTLECSVRIGMRENMDLS